MSRDSGLPLGTMLLKAVIVLLLFLVIEAVASTLQSDVRETAPLLLEIKLAQIIAGARRFFGSAAQ